MNPDSSSPALTLTTSAATFPSALPAEAPPRSAVHSPLVLWHLLSLDAPTVATLWTLFLLRSQNTQPPKIAAWPLAAAMFLAVWVLYAGDRLLDASPRGLSPIHGLEARHHFHRRHRSAFLVTMAAAAAALLFLLPLIPRHTLHLYLALAALLAAWLLLVHTPPRQTGRLPKELAVGLFFPAAVAIPVMTLPHIGALFANALLLAGACTLNCLFIYAWEHPSTPSSAHWTTRHALPHLPTLAALYIVAASAVTATLFLTHHSPFPALACALSGAFLAFLHTHQDTFPPTRLRALADAALLSPLPFLALRIALHR